MSERRRRLLIATTVAAVLGVGLFQEVVPVGRAVSSAAQPPTTAAEREAAYRELANEVSALERQNRSVKKVVRLIAPTVVHIDTTKSDRTSARFGGNGLVEEAGSGVVIEFKGKHYILTNRHVIRGAREANITIRLSDGREIHPKEEWSDAETDIAVMAVDADFLVPARLGDSRTIEIGDFVLAVGSPFGLRNSVTFGIISAKGRRDLELGDDEVRFQDFIQTDAAINPGNSGGPLVNLRGEVIGINTAIASNSGGNEGIGFSIPIRMVMAVAEQLIERKGNVVRAFLGVILDGSFGPTLAAKIGLPRPQGARIKGIRPNSPATEADIRVGDVILMFDGNPIEDLDHLMNVVSLTPVGKQIPVVLFRDREEVSIGVILGDRSQSGP